MAYSAGNPNQPSAPFDMQQLFRPPPSNPNPNSNTNYYSLAPPTGPYSFPPSTPPFHPPFLHYPQSALPQNPNPNPIPPNANPNPNPGARLMALLGTTPPSHLESAASMPPAPPPAVPALDFAPVLHATPSAPPAPMARVASSKMPRGRFLGTGERAVCDVESKLMGESPPPQLEVTPITKYISDPGLVLGRQIAVNRNYICYGLKLGNIRVLNINTAIRSLFRGHSQRVTDMAFFAEDVHLLASASVDGKVYVWKIDEGPDEENKPQITGKIVVAIQIMGEGEPYHPRICWHSHKQEVLIVAIGNRVLKIDATKVGRGKEFSAEEPLKCPIDKLIDGVQLIGKHEGDVTDLSISQWMITRLASASKDGTVKIWDDRRAVPLVTIRPHEGQPVSSVAFLTSPHNPEHTVLITAGPLNREVKIWTSTSEEGWLLPSDSETWQCTQTLELRSSLEPRPEEAFFNQVVVLPKASLILLANAKKNAIYAVHVDYGSCPASTRMDYIADFTVTMPILSLTGTSDFLPDGEQVVQIYCVQTHAIQQYALDLSRCLPPPVDALLARDSAIHVFDASSSEGFTGLEPSRGPSASAFPVGSATPKTSLAGSSLETAPTAVYTVPSVSSEVSGIHERATSNIAVKLSAPPLSSADVVTANSVLSGPLNMEPSAGLSIVRNPSKGTEQGLSDTDHDANQHVDHQTEGKVENLVTTAPDAVFSAVENSVKDDAKFGVNDNNLVLNSHLMYKLNGNTTHLVTPSEILSGAISASETCHGQAVKGDDVKVQDAVDNNDLKEGVHMEVNHADETRLVQHDSRKDQVFSASNRGKSFNNLVSEVNSEITKDGYLMASEMSSTEETRADVNSVTSMLEGPSAIITEDVQECAKDLPDKVAEPTAVSQSAKGKKQKAKQSQASAPSSPLFSPFNSTDSLNEPVTSMGIPLTDTASSQLKSMQDMLNQLLSMQKEMQKQMSSVIAGPVNKEGKRVETALGRSMEKSVKANVDAFWARFQEETAKHEKVERERMQQLTTLITNSINKDLPAIFERTLKKEVSLLGPALTRTITPIIEKSISSAVADSFQRGVGDKAVGQLEKSVSSKLEATVARQIQAQFQTSGKQALQEALRSSLESSVIPAFEQSCKGMFEQVDAVFQKGMNEHTATAQQQFESAHTPLAITLRDTINSASSITQNLTSELADGQRKIMALVTGNINVLSPMTMQPSNGPMGGIPEQALSIVKVEAPLDPTIELSRLISEHKFGEAFTMALQRSDVAIVSWLCSKVDLHAICSMTPPPLNQGVLLALLQQLACDISSETTRKLAWMTDVAVSIDPADPIITMHVRPIFEQVYNILAHQRSVPTTTTSEATSIRLIMHVINSVLMSCK